MLIIFKFKINHDGTNQYLFNYNWIYYLYSLCKEYTIIFIYVLSLYYNLINLTFFIVIIIQILLRVKVISIIWVCNPGATQKVIASVGGFFNLSSIFNPR